MTPKEGSLKKNEKIISRNICGKLKLCNNKSKFNVGDKFRIFKYKRKYSINIQKNF